MTEMHVWHANPCKFPGVYGYDYGTNTMQACSTALLWPLPAITAQRVCGVHAAKHHTGKRTASQGHAAMSSLLLNYSTDTFMDGNIAVLNYSIDPCQNCRIAVL